jgi:aryl-alcohol dehydrogenase-like predicted oxidoreductase
VLAQGDFIFPIPGTKHIKYLEENAGAVNIKLSATELAEINAVFPKDAAAGTRYHESAMQSLNL